MAIGFIASNFQRFLPSNQLVYIVVESHEVNIWLSLQNERMKNLKVNFQLVDNNHNNKNEYKIIERQLTFALDCHNVFKINVLIWTKFL